MPDSVLRSCIYCHIEFIDQSRSKNKKYCSMRCNTDAGHKRYKQKVEVGLVIKKKQVRNRQVERRKRYKENIQFRLSMILRTRLTTAIRESHSFKSGSAVRDLGCSIEELRSYLESKFQLGMSWGNYGCNGWHIDHIVPLSYFDLSNPDQLKVACHFTNLQPLWAKDNFRKSNHTS